MTRTLRAAAAIGVAAVALLSGCTAQGTLPATGTTAAPAAATRFACPSASEVAALTAVPLTASTTAASGCSYTTASDAPVATSVTVKHPGSGATLAALRLAAVSRGDRTADLRSLSFDAFTARTASSCTAWFTAPDGVATSVAARRSGGSGAAACSVAAATASLVGRGDPAGAARTVAVLAPQRLLGAMTAQAGWPWRIAGGSSLRIDRQVGTGYLRPAAATSFASLGAAVPRDSAAVVVVSGTAEAGAPRLEILEGVTTALSAIATRAPRAQVVVVGPVADASTPPADLAALRADLRTAAGIADVRYVDPAAAAAPGLDALADEIAARLRAAGVAAGG
uniref:hypothetical protein n=1 Tax=uncultured Amnibacterium sp. TaxID=1631851 RepID=UPI0035CBEA2A